MKILAKLIIVLTIFTTCTPVRGEILIYNKISNGFRAEGLKTPDPNDLNFIGFEWSAGEWTSRGYLLLDVEFDSDNQVVLINKATQIDYWRQGQSKYYEQTQLNFNIERINVGEFIYWTLTDINTPQDGQVVILMLRGTATMNNIAMSSSQNYKTIPLILKGTYIEYLDSIDDNSASIYHKIFSVSLRLNTLWTHVAYLYWQDYQKSGGKNFTHDPFEWAEGGLDINGNSFGIIKEWLQRNEYTDINGLDYKVD